MYPPSLAGEYGYIACAGGCESGFCDAMDGRKRGPAPRMEELLEENEADYDY